MHSESPTSGRSVVRFLVGDAELAVDASAVREVLGALELMRVPGGPNGLVGVVAWNGRAIAALDLASSLGGERRDRARARTLVVENRTSVVAIPVDRVHEPVAATAERAAHVVRVAYARSEVDVVGKTLPLFDLGDFVRGLDAVP